MSGKYDLAVIGGGPGGYVAAIRAAQLGKSVVCIEKRATLGGTCLNVGCIPSKALLDSSELFVIAGQKLAKHGIRVPRVDLDLAAMMQRKDQVVKGLTQGIAGLFQKNRVTHLHGTARLASPSEIVVTAPDGSRSSVQADAILLATGSAPTSLPGLEFNGETIVSSDQAIAFDRVPEHLIVVGAGYIGLELGSVWCRLGAKVSVLEYLPRILPNSDGEIASLVQRALVKQGLEFHLQTKVTGATVEAGRVTVLAMQGDKPLTFSGDRVLVAVGRRPCSANLGLEEAGVRFDPRTGKIPVDDHFRTNVPNIYAIGDLIAGPMLAHKAQEEGVAFAEMLAGRPAHINYDAIPSVIYIWPEVASVGKTEEELKQAGREYRVGKFPFAASGRARCMDEPEGLVKVLTDASTDRVLGIHIFGARASDLIAEAVTVMEFSGSAEDIARITHAHPTLSETLAEAAREAYAGVALHK
jgi:dihydrolipoamide dehydrogenase